VCFGRELKNRLIVKYQLSSTEIKKSPPSFTFAAVPFSETVKEPGSLTVKGILALHRGGRCPPWSARERGISRALGRFSAAHVAGKSIELDSRHPSRELCEASTSD